jgi:hypothetical protein
MSETQPESETHYPVCYWVDISDVIVDISPGWDIFARQNNAPELDVRRVVGRNLLDFISGDATKMYVRTLIQSVRLLRRPIIRTYRCDSPDTRREMEMRITLEGTGLIRWEHRILQEQTLCQRLDFKVVQTPTPPTPKYVVRCSVCNRLKAPQGWSEPDYAPSLPSEPDGKIPVIYGVCPECLAQHIKPVSGNVRLHAAYQGKSG